MLISRQHLFIPLKFGVRTVLCLNQTLNEVPVFIREKRKRSDLVIWQKPLLHRKIPKQHDNIKHATKNFDYITIADRLRMVIKIKQYANHAVWNWYWNQSWCASIITHTYMCHYFSIVCLRMWEVCCKDWSYNKETRTGKFCQNSKFIIIWDDMFLRYAKQSRKLNPFHE